MSPFTEHAFTILSLRLTTVTVISQHLLMPLLNSVRSNKDTNKEPILAEELIGRIFFEVMFANVKW